MRRLYGFKGRHSADVLVHPRASVTDLNISSNLSQNIAFKMMGGASAPTPADDETKQICETVSVMECCDGCTFHRLANSSCHNGKCPSAEICWLTLCRHGMSRQGTRTIMWVLSCTVTSSPDLNLTPLAVVFCCCCCCFFYVFAQRSAKMWKSSRKCQI